MARSTFVPWWELPNVTAVAVTPARARCFARSSLPQTPALTSEAHDGSDGVMQRDQYIHEIIHRYNMALMAGNRSAVDTIISSLLVPDTLPDANGRIHRSSDVARAALDGYQTFLDTEGIDTVVDSARSVRTPGRSILDLPDRAIILAGRIDLVGARRREVVRRGVDGGDIGLGFGEALACVDIETRLLTGDIVDDPASYVYDHLTRFAYGARGGGHARHPGRRTMDVLHPDRRPDPGGPTARS